MWLEGFQGPRWGQMQSKGTHTVTRPDAREIAPSRVRQTAMFTGGMLENELLAESQRVRVIEFAMLLLRHRA